VFAGQFSYTGGCIFFVNTRRIPSSFEFRKISFVSPDRLKRGCGFAADELRLGVIMALPLMLQLIGLTYSVRIDPYILKNAGTSCC